ncbi:C-X-C chemokine receptor type 1-like [Stylophora pistillata]|uniref:C-X-C chemokine receptor type 1-like n=1 Tax=Stylophora pistillata TaxID=50429 RepID=UPI000C041D40|nr:C-X-C chemokine receptor type 1-like [Stylophora pistillata]
MSDGELHSIIVPFGVTFYSIVFLLSVMGNSFVLSVCYRSIKRNVCSLKWFIASLALADLTFVFLSILDLISYLWTWIGGQISCKLQSFFIEAIYTVSITTLCIISYERLKAVVVPLHTIAINPSCIYGKLIASWIISMVVASPLLYAYQIQPDKNGKVSCTNNKFGDLGRQVYYGFHTIFFFLVPLSYMIYVQCKIFISLRLSTKVFPIRNTLTTARSKRHLKAAKRLLALTTAFAACWSPFICVRGLIYIHLADDGYIWKASQLLIFLNTVLDPILYGIYGERENFKAIFKPVIPCVKCQTRAPEELCYSTHSQMITNNERPEEQQKFHPWQGMVIEVHEWQPILPRPEPISDT